jgi:UDP-N-acetylmuramoyl-tripeptide--D-alanyl-D-alanine ligase
MATPIPRNRARFRVAELVAATGGYAVELFDEAVLEEIATDSRTVGARGLFVALRGESHDGHAFVAAARERGAIPLVAAGAGISGPRLEVEDPLRALAAIARAHVERLAAASGHRPLLAIGGSAGKTTTKTLAAAAVGALFGETLVSAGNLNNRIGLPMTLLTLAEAHRAIVVECGTSVRGEIGELAAIARPDVGLVVNVGIEHSERLGELEEIADEEGALLLAARRAAVTSADEPLLRARLARSPAPLHLTFGTAADADVRLRARAVGADGATRLRFALGVRLAPDSPELEIRTGLLGAHVAANVAAAVAAALALRGRPASTAELAALAAAVGAVPAVPGRLAPREIGELLVLDDSYNSNPRSLAAALAAARELAGRRHGRLLLALGDMLELGPLAAREHDAMLEAADAAGAAGLLLVGPETAAAHARRPTGTSAQVHGDSAMAAAALAGLVQPGDLLLVKGSRGMRMERLIAELERNSERIGP